MDIFVISLERTPERRIAFDNYNSQYINYTYHNAVDGATIDIDNLDKKILKKGSINYTKGAIGCALSHLQLWEKCVEMNKPILIMEDDAIVNCNFKKHMNNLINNLVPKSFDIVQLSYNFDSVLSYVNVCGSSDVISKVIGECDINSFVKSKVMGMGGIARLNNSFGTSCYLLSPSGGRLLKERCFPMYNRMINVPFLNDVMCYTIDCMMNSVYRDINAYVCIIPFVITPHTNKDYKSTIA
jgi:glycosyl transferase family 25